MSDNDETRNYNRPGLDSIKYSAENQVDILERMISFLSREELTGETKNTRPLSALTTRRKDDATIALLDAWSASLDVLGFYQERIANEGYIRTAIERRSILEQSRSIGYELKPGVSAQVHLSFIVDDAPTSPKEVNVPAGTRVMSIPGQEEVPQIFETSEDFTAHVNWNTLSPRLKQNQTFGKGATTLYLDGLNTVLSPGDYILFVGKILLADESWEESREIRRLINVDTDPMENFTLVSWEMELTPEYKVTPKIYAFRGKAPLFGHNAADWINLSQDVKDTYRSESFSTRRLAFSGTTSPHTIACGESDGRITLRDETGVTTLELEALENTVTDLVFSSDQNRIFASDSSGSVKILNKLDKDDVTTLDALSPVNRLMLTPDEQILTAGLADGRILFFDGSNATALGPEANAGSSITTLNYLAYGATEEHWAIIGTVSGDVQTLRFDGAERSLSLLSPGSESGGVTDLTVSADGGFLLTAYQDGSLSLRKIISTPETPPTLGDEKLYSMPGLAANTVLFPGTTQLVAGFPSPFFTAGEDGSLLKWVLKANDDGSWHEVEAFNGDGREINHMILTPGEILITASSSSEIRFRAALDGKINHTATTSLPDDFPQEWPNFSIQESKFDLDANYEKILNGAPLLVIDSGHENAYFISGSENANRNEFLLSGKVSRIHLQEAPDLNSYNLRTANVFFQAEELSPAEFPLKRIPPVEGDRMELYRLVTGLETGKTLILSGRLSRVQVKEDVVDLEMKSDDQSKTSLLSAGDILTILETPADAQALWRLETRTGFVGTVSLKEGEDPFTIITSDPESEVFSEILELKNLLHEQTYTIMRFEKPLLRSFDPETVQVNANVVEATHGQTIDEVLGSGDGSLINQVFNLKQPPLTHISAPTASGAESTLQIEVNGLKWDETRSLHDLGGREKKYMVRIEDDGSTRVIFGDGVNGERLATGAENVKAVYRMGIGKVGEVSERSLRLLQTSPLGIREVDNPLPATGGAESETRSQARERAPLSVLTLDRIVSLKDFQDFARSFAGIGKADAQSFQQDEINLVYVTIAGEGGNPVDDSSKLYENLKKGMDAARPPYQQMRMVTYQPLLYNIAAKILIDPAYQAARVLIEAEAALRERFSFDNIAFGQEVAASEIVAVLQNVPGALAVDLDDLYRDDARFFNLSLDFQDELENTRTVTDLFRDKVNELISNLTENPPAPLTSTSLVIPVKEGWRWLLMEPEASEGLAVLKEKGELNVYFFSNALTSDLKAERARQVGESILPSQLLLLNPDPAGVVLTEQE